MMLRMVLSAVPSMSMFAATLTRLCGEVTDLYPRVYALIGERNGNAGSGAGGDSTVAVPIRLDVLAFVAECYEGPKGEQWQGITLTVMDCEHLARGVLGREIVLRRRPAGWDGLSPDPRVGDALAWMGMVAPDVERADAELAEQLGGDLQRLVTTAQGFLRLGGPSTVTDLCPMCRERSFVADRDRAVCANPECRDDFGGRRCWTWDEGGDRWVMVPQPTVNERGRLIRRSPEGLQLLEIAAMAGAM